MIRGLAYLGLVGWVALAACSNAPVAPKRNQAKLRTSDPTWQQAARQVHEEVNPKRWSQEQLSEYILHQGGREQPIIALTLDDGPHAATTPKLLEVLRQEQVKATFFVTGFMAQKAPSLVREIAKEGHEIGNHSFSHATLARLPQEKILTEYSATNEVVQRITGKRPRFCRPPGGDFSRPVLEAAADLNLITVFWTNNPGDYAHIGQQEIVRRTLLNLTPGGIILLHDGPKDTLEALVLLIRMTKAMGYRFATLEEMMQSRSANPILSAGKRRSACEVKSVR